VPACTARSRSWSCFPWRLSGAVSFAPYRRVSFRLPARELGDLNAVAAGVVDHGDGRAGDGGGRLGGFSAMRLDALVFSLHVVSKEIGRRLILLKQGLLVRLGCRTVIQRQLQLCSLRLLGRGDGQPAERSLAEVGLLGEAEDVCVEAQSL